MPNINFDQKYAYRSTLQSTVHSSNVPDISTKNILD